MSDRRLREVYGDYQKGLIPFEQVVQAAETFLHDYAARRGDSAGAGRGASTGQTPQGQT